MKKSQCWRKRGSPNHGHSSSSSSSSSAGNGADYQVVCEAVSRTWSGYGSYKRVATMVWPSQRDGFLALRAQVVREERTCFWESVALAVKADRNRFSAVRQWFEAKQQCDVGVSPEGAGKLLEKFPCPIAVYYWDSDDGQVSQLNGQDGGVGVLFVGETDRGIIRPHWLPVAGLRRGVRRSARPSHTSQAGRENVDEVGESASSTADDSAGEVGESTTPVADVPVPCPLLREPCGNSVCANETRCDVGAPTIEIFGELMCPLENQDVAEAVRLPPRVRYLKTHSVSPPFRGTAYQAGSTKALRPTEVLATWKDGVLERLLGDKALETRPEILEGAVVDERTILFHRVNGTNPLDARLNMDGAIHLACLKSLACDGVTYVPGDIQVLGEGDSMWYYCRLRRQSRPWPCWPCIPFLHTHTVSRVCLVEAEGTLGDRDDFPTRAAQVRAQYAMLKVQGCIPEDLVGPLNDVRMEHLAEPEFEKSGFAVAGSMLRMKETVAKLGKAQLGFGNP